MYKNRRKVERKSSTYTYGRAGLCDDVAAGLALRCPAGGRAGCSHVGTGCHATPSASGSSGARARAGKSETRTGRASVRGSDCGARADGAVVVVAGALGGYDCRRPRVTAVAHVGAPTVDRRRAYGGARVVGGAEYCRGGARDRGTVETRPPVR